MMAEVKESILEESDADIARAVLVEMGGRAGMLELIERLRKDRGMTEASATMAVLDMTPEGYPSFNLASGEVSLPE